MTIEVTVKQKCPMCQYGLRWVGYWLCMKCGYREFGCCG